jgi:hypothetical protein
MTKAWDRQLDEQLRQLAIKAQEYPSYSPKRQIALTKLVSAIQKSGQLCRPHSGKFKGFYQEIYDEACNRVFLHICHHIESYDPERGKVLQWVNFLIKRRFSDAVDDILGLYGLSQKSLQIERSAKHRSLTQSFDCLSESDDRSLFKEVIFWIKTDPEGLFKNKHIRDRRDANFQSICLKKLEYTWKQLEELFGIKTCTLDSFYKRSLEEFAPIIRKYIEENG